MLLVGHVLSAAESCRDFAVERSGFEICIPTHWDVFVHPNGALFICTTKTSSCIESRGSYPRRGNATFEVTDVRRSASSSTNSLSLEEWISRTVRGPGIAGRQTVTAGTNRGIPSHIVEVRQVQQFASDPTIGYWVYYYFIESQDRRLLAALTFNLCEPKGKAFVENAVKTARSIRFARR